MTATLELPLNLTIAALRKAGTGDNLLEALDALVTTNSEPQEVVDETQPTAEWVNVVNLEDENVTEDNTEVTIEL
jgi:ribosome assembly protein YihI (activator of Der GTPase)